MLERVRQRLLDDLVRRHVDSRGQRHRGAVHREPAYEPCRHRRCRPRCGHRRDRDRRRNGHAGQATAGRARVFRPQHQHARERALPARPGLRGRLPFAGGRALALPGHASSDVRAARSGNRARDRRPGGRHEGSRPAPSLRSGGGAAAAAAAAASTRPRSGSASGGDRGEYVRSVSLELRRLDASDLWQLAERRRSTRGRKTASSSTPFARWWVSG